MQPRPLPFLPRRRRVSELLRRLREIARRLEEREGVQRVTVFDGFAFAPASPSVKRHRASARFDVVVLVETTTPSAIPAVRATEDFEELLTALRGAAKRLHVLAAANAKRVADVDKTRPGLFLFNYFVAEDAAVMLDLWDYLAGWYEVETGLDNSTLLVPQEGGRSDYVAVNNARWDAGLPRFLFRQFSKRSFRTYVQANLEANHVGAMPVLYRLASAGRGGRR